MCHRRSPETARVFAEPHISKIAGSEESRMFDATVLQSVCRKGVRKGGRNVGQGEEKAGEQRRRGDGEEEEGGGSAEVKWERQQPWHVGGGRGVCLSRWQESFRHPQCFCLDPTHTCTMLQLWSQTFRIYFPGREYGA